MARTVGEADGVDGNDGVSIFPLEEASSMPFRGKGGGGRDGGFAVGDGRASACDSDGTPAPDA